MIDSRSRSRSTAWRLRCASSLARRSRLVMSLKECTRKPISSREGNGSRVPKSPLPTARVPAIRSCTGRVRRCGEENRPVDRRQQGQQHHQRQRQTEADLERLAHRRQIAVLRGGVLHGLGQRRERLRHLVVDQHVTVRWMRAETASAIGAAVAMVYWPLGSGLRLT